MGKPTGAVGVGEAGDPVDRGREQHPMSVPGGGGHMRLVGSGCVGQDDVAGLGEEPTGGRGRDLLPDRWLGVEVEVLQCLDGTEPRGRILS